MWGQLTTGRSGMKPERSATAMSTPQHPFECGDGIGSDSQGTPDEQGPDNGVINYIFARSYVLCQCRSRRWSFRPYLLLPIRLDRVPAHSAQPIHLLAHPC